MKPNFMAATMNVPRFTATPNPQSPHTWAVIQNLS